MMKLFATVSALLAAIGFFLLLPAPLLAQEKPSVVLISIDGFKPDYLH